MSLLTRYNKKHSELGTATGHCRDLETALHSREAECANLVAENQRQKNDNTELRGQVSSVRPMAGCKAIFVLLSVPVASVLVTLVCTSLKFLCNVLLKHICTHHSLICIWNDEWEKAAMRQLAVGDTFGFIQRSGATQARGHSEGW